MIDKNRSEQKTQNRESDRQSALFSMEEKWRAIT
jgi:hypothetical protein